jgi:hypothetical protein
VRLSIVDVHEHAFKCPTFSIHSFGVVDDILPTSSVGESLAPCEREGGRGFRRVHLPRPDQWIDGLPERRQRQGKEGECKYDAAHDRFLTVFQKPKDW